MLQHSIVEYGADYEKLYWYITYCQIIISMCYKIVLLDMKHTTVKN